MATVTVDPVRAVLHTNSSWIFGAYITDYYYTDYAKPVFQQQFAQAGYEFTRVISGVGGADATSSLTNRAYFYFKQFLLATGAPCSVVPMIRPLNRPGPAFPKDD